MDGAGWFLNTSANWKNLSSPTSVLKRNEENVEQQQIDANTAVTRNVKFYFVMYLWSKIFLVELTVSR